MRDNFERELRRLKEDVLTLGSMVEGATMDSVEALKKRDMDSSRRLVAYDSQINERRFKLEHDTLTLIATQQPMAGDMRYLAAILYIVNELERMGDYAKGIARINLMIGEEALIKPLIDVPRMAEQGCSMLKRALDAFARHDVELARAVPLEDEIVDDLYTQVNRELLVIIMSNPTSMDQANYLQWAAHNLERFADRVVNICERVIYAVTGEMVEFGQISIQEEEE
jgi:phosphate transport system protein